MKTWILIAAGVPVALAVAVYGIGALLPRDHVASRAATIAADPARVADLVRHVEDQPRWRRGITAIEVVAREGSGLRYRERSADGDILFDFTEEAPGARFRSRIADEALPFGGAWTIDVAAASGGSQVSIEEHGMVKDPLYRFFSTMVFGHTATMEAYLADLRRAAERA